MNAELYAVGCPGVFIILSLCTLANNYILAQGKFMLLGQTNFVVLACKPHLKCSYALISCTLVAMYFQRLTDNKSVHKLAFI